MELKENFIKVLEKYPSGIHLHLLVRKLEEEANVKISHFGFLSDALKSWNLHLFQKHGTSYCSLKKMSKETSSGKAGEVKNVISKKVTKIHTYRRYILCILPSLKM